MITLNTFLAAIRKNAERITTYSKGCDGTGGKCDCVGLIIGALRLAGVTYKGTHGSNYFARSYTENLKRIVNVSQLSQGDLVYKASSPGEANYNLPSGYRSGSDLRDYYHIGVVLTTDPLCIAHCSTGGMNYDSKLGKWSYFGECKGVDYAATEDAALSGEASVDVPNDGTVRVRKIPGGTIVTTLREGDKVTVLDDNGTWAKVQFTTEGYIMSKFLRPL